MPRLCVERVAAREGLRGGVADELGRDAIGFAEPERQHVGQAEAGVGHFADARGAQVADGVAGGDRMVQCGRKAGVHAACCPVGSGEGTHHRATYRWEEMIRQGRRRAQGLWARRGCRGLLASRSARAWCRPVRRSGTPCASTTVRLPQQGVRHRCADARRVRVMARWPVRASCPGRTARRRRYDGLIVSPSSAEGLRTIPACAPTAARRPAGSSPCARPCRRSASDPGLSASAGRCGSPA